VTVGRALGLIAGLVPSAQSIRPADYLPLGQGAQWQYERTFKAIDKDDVAIVHVEATATSAADFTISKVTVAVQARGGKQEGERRHGGQWMSRAEEHPVADRRPLPVLAFLSIHGPRGPRKLALGGSVIVRSTCGRWATACERNFPTPTRLGP